jgi:hypothetical protein
METVGARVVRRLHDINGEKYMKRALVLVLLLMPAPAHAADKVIGLLSLPELFWEETGPCDDQFKAQNIQLYAAPASTMVIGEIRVDRVPPPSEVQCEVNVHLRERAEVTALPTKEYAYEQRGAVVLDRRADWYKLRIESGAGWIHASPKDQFFSLVDLLWRHRELSYATESWDQRLASRAGGTLAPLPPNVRKQMKAEADTRVVGSRLVGGRLWLQIELLNHSFCEGDEPKVLLTGWLPAHAASGEPTIWFPSRGC